MQERTAAVYIGVRAEWKSLSACVRAALLPQECGVCGGFLAPGERAEAPLCARCAQVDMIGRPWCEQCGIGLISEEAVCARCREGHFAFERNRGLFDYRGANRDILALYKFGNMRRMAEMYIAPLWEAWSEEYAGVPIVPVPGAPKAVRARGWDQMGVIAEALRARYSAPILPIIGRRRGASQKFLDRQGREEHAGELYYLKHADRRRYAMPHAIVLLDDVLTTGATLNACAQVALAGGCRVVYALTLLIKGA